MEPIERVVQDIKNRHEKIGLYMIDYNVATSDTDAVSAAQDGSTITEDFRKKLAAGESAWIVQGVFTIGDVAFSDRVLNPEKVAADDEFALAVPDEVEMAIERVRRLGLKAFEPEEDEE